jgi:hypothetical protein
MLKVRQLCHILLELKNKMIDLFSNVVFGNYGIIILMCR